MLLLAPCTCENLPDFRQGIKAKHFHQYVMSTGLLRETAQMYEIFFKQHLNCGVLYLNISLFRYSSQRHSSSFMSSSMTRFWLSRIKSFTIGCVVIAYKLKMPSLVRTANYIRQTLLHFCKRVYR